MRSLNYIVGILFFVVAAGCGKVRNEKNVVAAETDSITRLPMDYEILELPDTSYASVALIKYTVREVDTVENSKVNSLRDLYRDTPGIFAFRGNSFRDGDMRGKVKGRPSEISVDWDFKTSFDKRDNGSHQGWGGGSGWTGQPVYVEWPDSLVKKWQSKGFLYTDFSGKEIIVGSLSSYLYFIDFETGLQSRDPIYVSNPIKGSVSLDPTFNGNVYIGHGIPNERPFGAIVVNLNTHSVSDIYPEDPKSPRKWGAYDSSSIRVGQFVFRPGENGVIYKFLALPGAQKLHSAMSYRAGGSGPGIEASMSVYGNYGYTADNHGFIVCTNLNTMKPVWVYSLGDDTDSTPVISVEDGVPYLYTGCEIDLNPRGYARFVKLNALDGSLVWEKLIPGRRFDIGGKHFDGGFYASTLPGKGKSSHMLFINMVENLERQNGKFMALDRNTGEIVYEIPLKHYAWSSPVGFLNELDEMYIVTGDCAGNVYLIDAQKGEIITSKPIGANFESSPVVNGNSAVVGSRGDRIYRLSIK